MSTKDLILEKTYGLLLEKGYDGVSISDIQQATGMARGLLYHYFGSQEVLFEESIGKYFIKWFYVDREKVKGCLVGETITYSIEQYGRVMQELAEFSCGKVSLADLRMLLLGAIRHHGSLADLYKTVCEERFLLWKNALLNSFTAGELRNGLNLESLAWHFVYIQEGAIIESPFINKYSEDIYVMERGLRDFYEIIRR